MFSLKYRITARSSVVISKISGDANMVETEQLIPGSTVLGVLARRFIDARGIGPLAHEHEEFYRWFLLGQLKTGNAYILTQDEYGEHFHYPTPLSIVKEKYGTEAYDYLFHERQQEGRTEHVGDFGYLERGVLYKKAVQTEVNFHHQRDRGSGTSEKGMIFNYRSIAAGQTFGGAVHGSKEDLESLLKICGSNWPAFVGRSKNAQYGSVQFEFVDKAAVSQRSHASWPKESDGEAPAECVSMTLLSDLILYNECGFPTTDVEDLQGALQQLLGEVRIEKSFISKSEVENFIAVWRLKRPSETCFCAGSTFLLKIAPDKMDGLAGIEETGLGERTHEGFGRCAFASQTQKSITIRDEAKQEDKRKIRRPPGDMPEGAVRVLRTAVRSIILERVKFDAINKQGNFKRLPSNSLIARLQTMARTAKDRPDFVLALNEMRDTAQKQLRRCSSRNCNLLEYLAAFRLPQSCIEGLIGGLKEIGLPEETISGITKDAGRQLTLVKDPMKAPGKGWDKRAEFRKFVLAHAEFRHRPINWGDFFRQPENIALRDLCKEAGLEMETDEQFTRQLNHCFYATFFAEMRKRKIAEGGERNAGQSED